MKVKMIDEKEGEICKDEMIRLTMTQVIKQLSTCCHLFLYVQPFILICAAIASQY